MAAQIHFMSLYIDLIFRVLLKEQRNCLVNPSKHLRVRSEINRAFVLSFKTTGRASVLALISGKASKTIQLPEEGKAPGSQGL